MTLDLQSLLQATSEAFGVNAAAIRNRGKVANLALARQTAMAIARDQGLSPNAVGRIFLRDRGTVIHACRVVKQIIQGKSCPERDRIQRALMRFREIAAQNRIHQ